MYSRSVNHLTIVVLRHPDPKHATTAWKLQISPPYNIHPVSIILNKIASTFPHCCYITHLPPTQTNSILLDQLLHGRRKQPIAGHNPHRIKIVATTTIIILDVIFWSWYQESAGPDREVVEAKEKVERFSFCTNEVFFNCNLIST